MDKAKEWLMIDKADDFHYFEDRYGIAKYLNLTIPEVNAIICHSKNNICFYSPSRKVYIQRLFNNPVVRPVEKTGWNLSIKNRCLIEWLGKIYITII